MEHSYTTLVNTLDRLTMLGKDNREKAQDFERHSALYEWYSGLALGYSLAATDLAKSITEIFNTDETEDNAI